MLKETKWLVVMSRNTVVHRLKPNTMVRFTSLEILIPLKPMARTGMCRVDFLACKMMIDKMLLDTLSRGLVVEEIKRKTLASSVPWPWLWL